MSRAPDDKQERAPRGAGDRTLARLKARGPQRVADLSLALGVTTEAARQTLVRLEAEGLVAATAVASGVGRPAQVWALTEAGNARFPDAHAELTAQLLTSVQELLGQQALDVLIGARESASREAYREAMRGARGLGQRVERLAGCRTREGYMAEVSQDGDGFLLAENHCPICVAARTCAGFCRAELRTFEEVLEADVERVEHIVEGARRCLYRIRPRRAKTDLPRLILLNGSPGSIWGPCRSHCPRSRTTRPRSRRT